jgi:DNA-directed RNA polymerase subunit RPC12/RpoP
MNQCDLHTESGETVCITCGTGIAYRHVPFFPLAEDGSKGVRLQCNECSDKTRGEGQIATLQASAGAEKETRRSKK